MSTQPEPTRYLSLSGLAAAAGISVGTARSYSHQGRLPAPDAVIGNGPSAVRGWTPATVQEWMANRPGRGARTDLHKDTDAK